MNTRQYLMYERGKMQTERYFHLIRLKQETNPEAKLALAAKIAEIDASITSITKQMVLLDVNTDNKPRKHPRWLTTAYVLAVVGLILAY